MNRVLLFFVAACSVVWLFSCTPRDIDEKPGDKTQEESNPLLTFNPCDLSTYEIDFGEQEIGQFCEPKTIMIRNGTYAPTEVYSRYYSDVFQHQFYGDFRYTASVPALDSLEMRIGFWPKEEKSYRYEYILYYSGGLLETPYRTIILKGKGVNRGDKKPHWNLKSDAEGASTKFGDVPVGSSKSYTLIVENYGPGVLHVNDIFTYGKSKSISISKTSFDVPYRRSESVVITFKPTEKGELNDWLLISSNTANSISPTPIQIEGKGI